MDLNSTDHRFDLSQVEVINDLLEDCWFFDNLLNRRSSSSSRVLTLRHCHSDPYPCCSSSSKPKKTLETRNSASEKNLEDSPKRGLMIKPCIESKKSENDDKGEAKKMSMLRRQLSEKIRVQERSPSYLSKKELIVGEKGRESSVRKGQSSRGNLQRTKTLPSCIGREDLIDEFEDQESYARLGFLIREALASSSSGIPMAPPRHDVPKSSSIPKHKPPRNSGSPGAAAIQETRQANPYQKTLLRKTLSFNLETKETQKSKDLEIRFNKKQDSSPNLRDKKHEHSKICQDNANRAYPVDPLVGKYRCAAVRTPIPAWVPKESRKDMKAQIKFWARAVASNVRQEC